MLQTPRCISPPIPYLCTPKTNPRISNNGMVKFEVTEEYIELIKLLKVLQIAESGAMAKALVDNEEVLRNGEIETRKRAKIRKGETIQVLGETIVTF